MSRFGENYDPNEVSNANQSQKITLEDPLVQKTIKDIKDALKQENIDYYLSHKVTDDTNVGGKKWKAIKAELMKGDDYKKSKWFAELDEG